MVVVVAIASGSAPAWADEPSRTDDAPARDATATDVDDGYRLHWKPEWRPFQLGDYAWTATTLAVYSYMQFVMPTAKNAKWTGPILFDAAARDALRAEDQEAREDWATFSTITWYAMSASPFVTSTLVPLVDHGNWRVMLELNLVTLQGFALTGFLARIGHVFVGRERPSGGNNASFPGGHAAGAFAGAGASCVHHLELGLFGHPVADVGWCAALVGVASASALARTAADKHYMSDTLFGVAIGLAGGVGVPLLFHYHWGGSAEDTEAAVEETGVRWSLTPATPGSGLGIGAVGFF